jgi:hypothetical protein
MTVICKTLDVALLTICSQIYHEAMPFIAPKLKALMAEPVRLVMDYALLVADEGAIIPANPSFPMFKQLFARCRALAARTGTSRLAPNPHQVEIALTQSNRHISDHELIGLSSDCGVQLKLMRLALRYMPRAHCQT